MTQVANDGGLSATLTGIEFWRMLRKAQSPNKTPVGLEIVVTRTSAVDNVHLNVLATEWLNF